MFFAVSFYSYILQPVKKRQVFAAFGSYKKSDHQIIKQRIDNHTRIILAQLMAYDEKNYKWIRVTNKINIKK